MTPLDDVPEPTDADLAAIEGDGPLCNYYHLDNEGGALPDRLATWAYIGEAGEDYVCDEHFAMRTEEGSRGWSRI